MAAAGSERRTPQGEATLPTETAAVALDLHDEDPFVPSTTKNYVTGDRFLETDHGQSMAADRNRATPGSPGEATLSQSTGTHFQEARRRKETTTKLRTAGGWHSGPMRWPRRIMADTILRTSLTRTLQFEVEPGWTGGPQKIKQQLRKKIKVFPYSQVNKFVSSFCRWTDFFSLSLSLSLSVFHDQSAVPNGGQKFVFSSPFFLDLVSAPMATRKCP